MPGTPCVGGWGLAAVGGWWLVAVDGPLGRSLRVVLNKKKKSRRQRTALALPASVALRQNSTQKAFHNAETLTPPVQSATPSAMRAERAHFFDSRSLDLLVFNLQPHCRIDGLFEVRPYHRNVKGAWAEHGAHGNKPETGVGRGYRGRGVYRASEHLNLQILGRQNPCHCSKMSEKITYSWQKVLMRNSGRFLLFSGGLLQALWQDCCSPLARVGALGGKRGAPALHATAPHRGILKRGKKKKKCS